MLHNFKLLDCTLREGIQSIDPIKKDRGVVFTCQESVAIIQMLLDFKIDFLEFGAPIQSNFSTELISTAMRMASHTSTKINIHCRLHEDDLHSTMPLSPHGFNFYFNLSRSADASVADKVINKLIHFSKQIKHSNPNATVRFSFENAFKTNYGVIAQVTKAILPYIDRIGLPDTSGGAKPTFVRRRLVQLRRDFPELPLELHFHNDFGLAVANMYEAIHVKNVIIHTTILGLGERNGIVSTSQAVALGMMTTTSAKRTQANFDVTKLELMDEYVAKLLKMPIPTSMPITSVGFFSHLAGVHVHGQTLNKSRYQLLNPEIFARQANSCWASAVVGKANIAARAVELGIPISASESQIVAAQVREYAKVRGGVSPRYVDTKIKQFLRKK